MKSTFPLFNGHLDLAQHYWTRIVRPDSIVIDMTAGNGHDTAFLDGLKPARLIALDIQPEAIAAARARVSDRVEFFLEDHATFPEKLEAGSIDLAVYNLGWLPGSDKTVTTQTESTLKSVRLLLPKMKPGGVISITCYPGHLEGEKEEEALIENLAALDPKQCSLCHHRFLNRHKAPSLILLQTAAASAAEGPDGSV
jgi:tRNA G37 N-methylase Trm5